MNKQIEAKFLHYLTLKLNSSEIALTLSGEILSGWETEIYFFEISPDLFSNSKIVLRLYPHINLSQKAENEYHCLSWLHQKGYSVPTVLLLETDPNNSFKRPFIVLEQIEGSTLTDLLGRSNPSEQERLMLIFMKKFLELHKIDITNFPKESTLDSFKTYLDGFDAMIKKSSLDFARPVLDWLSNNLSELKSEPLSIIHGDYHSDNVIVNNLGNFYIIDWASANISEFRFDLGWTLILTRLYIGKEVHDKLFHLYEHECGKDIEHIRFFEVVVLLRRLIDISKLLTEPPELHGMRQGTTFIIKSEKELISKLLTILDEYTNVKIDLAFEHFTKSR